MVLLMDEDEVGGEDKRKRPGGENLDQKLLVSVWSECGNLRTAFYIASGMSWCQLLNRIS